MGLATLGAMVIAGVFITACSLLPEPTRQNFNAIFVAGAGAAYLNGGIGALGPLEFGFTTLVTIAAFWGLQHYRWIGVAWMLHVGWDIVHHVVGEPIIGLDPLSSYGCVICDTLLAIWFFAGAPSVFQWRRRQDPLDGISAA